MIFSLWILRLMLILEGALLLKLIARLAIITKSGMLVFLFLGLSIIVPFIYSFVRNRMGQLIASFGAYLFPLVVFGYLDVFLFSERKSIFLILGSLFFQTILPAAVGYAVLADEKAKAFYNK